VRWYLKVEENGPYHVYTPIEYVLLILFYRKNTKNNLLRDIMGISAFIYPVASILISLLHYHFTEYPSTVYNISCVLNVVWIVFIFFELNSVSNIKITSLPLFWILASLLIFYSGIFFFNGAYNFVLNKDSHLAAELRNYINIFLNYILYILMIYAFICSIKLKKYSFP
jgi:hypothetical protein